MFAGFDTFDLQTAGSTIHGRHHAGTEGMLPVLLLHGFPQCHVMWHPLAAVLASSGHPVVAADLRGYGRSSRPPGLDDHSGYSFRAMADDQVAVMEQLGYRRFAVVGHDRGARVTHRMAIDHPAQVERLVLMDILPTAHVYANVTRRTATAYYHWFFFIQPYDLPERMISADPIWYLHRLLAGWASPIDGHHPDALAAYEEAFSDPEARHAMMEDYRAGAKIDLRLDEESAAAGRRIQAPALVLWGGRGLVGSDPEGPLAVWRRLTDRPGDMEGAPIEGAGHFMLEDRPDDTIAALTAFLSQPPR